MSANLERLASRISGTPLLITQRKLDVILNVLSPRLGIEAPEVDVGAFGEESSGSGYEVHGGVAVVPVHGTLLHRCLGMDALSGLTSYGDLGDMIETAIGDPHVHHVVLDVDSSGGEANGVFDQVDRIYGMRGEKPITAVVNEEANSAAYAIASAADRIVTTRTALAGSIGVIATHIDQSGANASEGLQVTHVFAGERKADYTPHAPLSDEAQQRLQEQVNATYDIFVETVARNRGLGERAVRETRAAFFMGRTAVTHGLADAVDTVEAVVKRAKQQRGNTMSRTNRSQARRRSAAAETGGSCPLHAGENLGNELQRLIEEQVTEERSAQDVQDDMAEAAGIDPSTVDDILSGGINCPPRQRLEGFAEVLDTTTEALISVAEEDGCDYSEDGGDGSEASASAADIADLCHQSGCPDQAASLIREGATMANARQRVNAVGTMHERCKAAVSAGMVSRQRADSLLQGALDAKKSPDQLSADILSAACREQSPDEAVHSRITPDSKAADPDAGWQAAVDRVSKSVR